MNQLRVFLATNLGEHTRRFGVDAKSLLTLCFAKIDIGERRRVNEHIEIYPTELLANLIQIREIELRVIESGDVMFALIFAHERRAKPPARADNQNFHLLWNRVVKKTAHQRRAPKSAVRNPQSTNQYLPARSSKGCHHDGLSTYH